MATLLSVNVGMPKDVSWQGRTVHTGAWKSPVHGPRMVRRLNIDGDGQGDLAGHGGDIRAVLVYQLQSYRYWRKQLGRDDLTFGSFGENFTVDGLPDDEVCIGDRYRIGEAEFEVTQPRVTCYRVGMRLGEPTMAALLVAHHRPGFYLRVLTEGHVQVGDEITLIRKGPEELSVADTDALLYLPDRDPALLHKALNIPALSPGWQQSFRELATAQRPGQEPGWPGAGAGNRQHREEPGWPGFKALRVARIVPETPTVSSIYLDTTDGTPLPEARAGQYLSLRLTLGDTAPWCAATHSPRHPQRAPTASASSTSPTGRSAAISMPRSTPGTSWTSPAPVERSCSKTAPARSCSFRRGSVSLPYSPCSTSSPPPGTPARSGGSTPPMTAPTTPSRTRPTRFWRSSPTPTSTSTTPPKPRLPMSRISRGAARPLPHSRPWAFPLTPTPTSADRPPSWTPSAACCTITGWTPCGFIRNSSAPSPPSTPASHPRPRSGHTSRPVPRAAARSSPSPAAVSPPLGHRPTPHSSTSPKPAMSPPAGPAAPASATPASPTSSRARPPTPPHRSNPRARHRPRLLQPAHHRSRPGPVVGRAPTATALARPPASVDGAQLAQHLPEFELGTAARPEAPLEQRCCAFL